MGQSTDGQICFGVVFEEDAELPWEAEEYDGIEDWWTEVGGFKAEFDPYTDEGEFKQGVSHTDPRVDKYYNDRVEWRKRNPLPVELVNSCSTNCPMWIIAVRGTVQEANRGFPIKFDPAALTVDPKNLQAFIDFVGRFEIEFGGDPAWYLSSYWG